MAAPGFSKSRFPDLLLAKAEGGFSMTSVMIAVAIIGVVAGGILTFTSMSQQQRKALATGQASAELAQALEGALIGQMKANACFSPAAVFNNTPVGGFGTMSFTRNVTFAFKTAVAAAIRAPWDAAQARCAAPRQPNAGSNYSYYFCVKFAGNALAPTGSFMRSANSFAEVYLDTRNLQTDQPIDCNTFNSQPQIAGGRLYHTMYWTAEGGQGTILKNQTTSLYIGR